MDTTTYCCFTGHRTLREPEAVIQERLTEILTDLIRQGYRHFCAGGALGFDTLAAKTVLELKKTYEDIHLILVLPFPDQYEKETGWSETDIAAYQDLKTKALRVIHVMDSYCRGCYYRRNVALVNCSSVCVAYQYKASGGTAYTTAYAAEKNVPVINCASQRKT